MIIYMTERVGVYGENKDIARDIRISVILPSLEKSESIIIDFEGVTGATQSFIHASPQEQIGCPAAGNAGIGCSQARNGMSIASDESDSSQWNEHHVSRRGSHVRHDPQKDDHGGNKRFRRLIEIGRASCRERV